MKPQSITVGITDKAMRCLRDIVDREHRAWVVKGGVRPTIRAVLSAIVEREHQRKGGK